MMSREKRRGFMVIEMFVVIAIVVVLVTVATYFLARPSADSRDDRRLSDLKQIAHALLLYIDAKGVYPSECNFSTDPCWSTFVDGYIDTVPADPINRNKGSCETSADCFVYRYCRVDGGGRFVLSTNLEHSSRNAFGVNPDCPLGGANPYWITN